MFDIGWSELVVIGVVALIAIGPKELPGVLRTVGQYMGKIRRMASEFQGQFQEAMREAEMADLKKSFDEVREAATGFASGNVMTGLQKDVASALSIEDIDKPTATAEAASSAPASTNVQAEAEAHAEVSQPLAITPEAEPEAVTPDTRTVALGAEVPRDSKAS
jgi:sec-independent protein translocase protein TatB